MTQEIERLVEPIARAMHSEGIAIFLENNPRSTVPDWDGDEQDARDALARMARAVLQSDALSGLIKREEGDGERFLLAYVSADTRVIGIEHPTEAAWADVLAAHVALRDRLNLRIRQQRRCPFRKAAALNPKPEGE